MKLQVRVLEARNLPAIDVNGFSYPYVILQLRKQRSQTKVVKNNLNPKWSDDFSFGVDDLNDELVVSVLDEDKHVNDDFLGQVRVPISIVFDAENQSLGTVWYPLLSKNKSSKEDCGEILLSICFIRKNSVLDLSSNGDHASCPNLGLESSTSASASMLDDAPSSQEDKSICRHIDPSRRPVFSLEDESSSASFEEVMKTLESKDQASEPPSNLPGGILVDQLFMISPSDLNALLFSSDSSFYASLNDLQGTTQVEIGSWKVENEGENAKRVVSYLKAPTKLLKAVQSTEEQTYLKANREVYSVFASVSTPDVPFGSAFKVTVLYCITPGPELPSGEQYSRLVVSWRLNFLQNTMMKCMIESGARQGLKENFEQYTNLLSQHVKPLDSKDIGTNEDQSLSPLQAEPQSL